MRGPTSPARLGLFWLGIQAVWGAVLGVSLQARTAQLSTLHALASYGAIATAGALAAAAAQIAVGPLSDSLRTRGRSRIPFYALGALLAAGALWWFYLAPSLLQLATAFVCLQLAMNVGTGPYQAVIPDYLDSRATAAASAWMAALQSIGNAVGAMAAAFVGDVRAVAALLSGLLVGSASATIAEIRKRPLRRIDAQPLRVTRAFVDLFVSRGLLYLAFYTLVGYVFFYVELVAGRSDATRGTGIALVLFTLSGAAGAAVSARPTRYFDRRGVVTAAVAVFVAALLWLVAGGGQIVVPVVVAGFAWGAFLVADWTLGCAVLPRSALATGMGMWNLALVVPQIAAPSLTTAVLATLHVLNAASAPRYAFAAAAIEAVLGAAWIWRLPARLTCDWRGELGIESTTVS